MSHRWSWREIIPQTVPNENLRQNPRNSGAMVSWLLTGSPPWLALISEWGLIGATHWGQQGTPALMLPYMRDGLSAADGGGVSVPQVLHVSPHAPRMNAQRV